MGQEMLSPLEIRYPISFYVSGSLLFLWKLLSYINIYVQILEHPWIGMSRNKLDKGLKIYPDIMYGRITNTSAQHYGISSGEDACLWGGALASFAPPANFDWLTRLGARAIVSDHFPGSFFASNTEYNCCIPVLSIV